MIDIDLAKHALQLHGPAAAGRALFRRRLRRGKMLPFLSGQPACDVVMEACTSAHCWAREIGGLGHRVRLIAPASVKPLDLLVRQRTCLVKGLRAHLAEFGVVAPKGLCHVRRSAALMEQAGSALPEPVRRLCGELTASIGGLTVRMEALDREVKERARADEVAGRLQTISLRSLLAASLPGIGSTAAWPSTRSGR